MKMITWITRRTFDRICTHSIVRSVPFIITIGRMFHLQNAFNLYSNSSLFLCVICKPITLIPVILRVSWRNGVEWSCRLLDDAIEQLVCETATLCPMLLSNKTLRFRKVNTFSQHFEQLQQQTGENEKKNRRRKRIIVAFSDMRHLNWWKSEICPSSKHAVFSTVQTDIRNTAASQNEFQGRLHPLTHETYKHPRERSVPECHVPADTIRPPSVRTEPQRQSA